MMLHLAFPKGHLAFWRGHLAWSGTLSWTTQPVNWNGAYNVATALKFTVLATGAPTITYQWYSSPDGINWTLMVSQTAVSLSIPATWSNDWVAGTGYFRCRASAAGCPSINSNAVRLNITSIAYRLELAGNAPYLGTLTYWVGYCGNPIPNLYPTIQWETVGGTAYVGKVNASEQRRRALFHWFAAGVDSLVIPNKTATGVALSIVVGYKTTALESFTLKAYLATTNITPPGLGLVGAWADTALPVGLNALTLNGGALGLINANHGQVLGLLFTTALEEVGGGLPPAAAGAYLIIEESGGGSLTLTYPAL